MIYGCVLFGFFFYIYPNEKPYLLNLCQLICDGSNADLCRDILMMMLWKPLGVSTLRKRDRTLP